MTGSTDQSVSDIVARFFEQRRSGQRVSIDEVLETVDVPNPSRIRAEALSRIARESAMRLSSAETLDLSGQSGASPTGWTDLPEIEGYDLIDILGKGGMGVVYEAYQQSTGRRVAIKFMLGQAAATETGRRRFEREVELIARLQHPGVVSILDSGVHRRRWFYVMEYVDGAPLDDALRPGACDPRDVFRLVARVCDAVDYAHQRGVLHRDLKPSNIIVDSRGEPRLLDFGLAKAIDPVSKMGVETSVSEPGQIIGTLAFMPPEQSRGRSDEIGVRTDVYSLGAIAYELLTGALPCAMDGSLSDILKRIEEVDPPAPSSIRAGVSKDADAILLKALEKSPAHRYASVGELAADIRRLLADKPILARRTGVAVRAGRWMRRNRLATTVGGVALFVILIVTAIATINIVSSISQRLDQTELQQQTSAWLGATLGLLSPDSGYFKQSLTLEEQNDAYARRLATDPPRRPEVAAAVHSYVGKNYLQLRSFDKAELHDRRALEILRTVYSKPNPDLARAIHNLAAVLWWKGEYADAEPLYREALAMRRTLFGDDSLETADTTNHLAACLDRMGEDKDAERLYREALRIRRGVLGERPKDQEPIAASLNNLAAFLLSRRVPEQAEPLFRESLSLIASLRGADDRRVGSVLTNLAECLTDQGRADEAEPLLVRSLAIYRRRLGDDNTSVAMAMYQLARVRLAQQKHREALDLAGQSLEIRRRKLPAGHPHIADALALVGRIHLAQRDFAGAIPPLRESLDIRRDRSPADPLLLAVSSVALAAALHDSAPTESASLISDALDRFHTLGQPLDRRAEHAVRACFTLLTEAGLADLAAPFDALLHGSAQDSTTSV